ncbi:MULTISPECIES: hypothetical protein [Kordiimonas]|jgi:hypothetical protein|uniref:hypothetical protein n=1 Tax=Kordiimonas TaxID=288021 RepID=UPI00257A6E76|nr:hypothetical protein [Kordiimonas sp. UBA4487]
MEPVATGQISVLKQQLTGIAAGLSAADALRVLHDAEIGAQEAYDWPWQCWPAYVAETPALADEVARIFEQADTTRLNEFELGIFRHAQGLRRADPDLQALGNFLGNPGFVLGQIGTLAPAFLVELAQMAFAEKRWRIVAAAAGKLLRERPWAEQSPQMARLLDLLFEMLFFATYRPAMPLYIRDPSVLLGQLDALAAAPHLQDILSRDGITAYVFRAGRLALEGKLDEALPLYTKANNKRGFSTPVIRQYQTVLETGAIEGDEAAALESWYAATSHVRHVFRHEGAKHALLVGCNQHYFDLYAALYLESVGVMSPGALVHLHILNGDMAPADLEAQLDAWEAAYGVQLNYSLEANEIAASQPEYVPAISACARYLSLPDFLDAYDTVTITDIDGWVDAPLSSMTVDEGDIRISSWIWRKGGGYWRLPWSNLAAGLLSVKANEAGCAFARRVRHYLINVTRTNVALGRQLFYMDQVALFLTLRQMADAGDIHVGFLRGGFEQSEEQRFGVRHEGKRQAMVKKIEELRQQVSTN